MSKMKIEHISDIHTGFLRDESRKTGTAETISFPTAKEEIAEILSRMNECNTRVTIQGARTGITGGAVPFGGHVLNLSRMDRVTGMRFDEALGSYILTVQPGLELLKLRRMLEKKEFDTQGWKESSLQTLQRFKQAGKWFFPPDPTETSASVGGMAACNASGARSFLYGPTRRYIESMLLLLADGSELTLRRKTDMADGDVFTVVTSEGRRIKGRLPDYQMPRVKNASGYYAEPGMELIDLFIGSEGTLGIAAELEIRLLPLPECIWGITAFFQLEEDALRFVRALRGDFQSEIAGRGVSDGKHCIRPVAIEFFNSRALGLLRIMKRENPAFKNLLHIPESASTAIYIEYHGKNREELFDVAEAAAGTLETCGGDREQTWVAAGDKDMEKLHFFRHAIPEAVNLTIDERRKKVPGLTKLGTDMAVPDRELETVLAMYDEDLKKTGLDFVIFGHIGNNHVHVNILPRSMEEYGTGKELYEKWARRVISLGGTVSAEHGIGKMKTSLLREMYGDSGIRQMLQVKQCFDPRMLLNPGNLFEQEV